MALFSNESLRNNPALRRYPGDERAWRTFIQALNSQQITASGTTLGAQGWATTTVFSATDADTVAWAAGTLTIADGTAYSISGSNTGNMVARTYIYFDKTVSTTAFQTTTTAGSSVGDNKLLIAVAENTTTSAFFQVFGGIGGVLVTANEIAANTITANEIAAGTITAAEITVSQLSAIAADLGAITAGTIALDTSGYIKSGQSAYDTGTGWWLEYNSGTPRFSIGNAAANKLTWDGTTLGVVGTVSGSIAAGDLTGSVALSATNIAAQGWTTLTVFSSTDADTVAWTTAALTTAAGTVYSITGANTGNMVARTYIYLDIGVSTTAFQTTTTAATAIGTGKILVAVAENVTGEEASFQVFGGVGGLQITSNEIAANAITANSITAGVITAAKMASTLTWTQVMDISTAGNLHSGQTAYNTGTGFWLEYNGGTPRFSMGNPSGFYMRWTGTDLEVNSTSSIIQAFKASDEVVNNSTTLQDDDDLTGLALAANQWYSLELFLRFLPATSSSNANLKFFLVFSQTPQVNGYGVASQTGTALTTNVQLKDLSVTTGVVTGDINVESGATIIGQFQTNASTGGTLKLQWAQHVAAAVDLTLRQGSHIKITPLG